MTKAIVKTDFRFDGQKSLYEGKVRDVYNIDDQYLVMVVSDRISAFDVVLPKGIPYKGQVLNQIASKFLDATSDMPELENRFARSDGDGRLPLRLVSGRDDRARLPDRQFLAGLQSRRPGDLRRAHSGRDARTPAFPAPDRHADDQSRDRRARSEYFERGDHRQRIGFEGRLRNARKIRVGAVRSRKQDGCRAWPDPGRYEVRIRQEGRRDLPDRRDSYAGQFALFLCRRLRGTFCERRAAASVVEGVCPRMADGPRFPGEARTAGSRR